MSKICIVTGKKPKVGNNVSHSNVKTKRRQFPNLQKRRILNPANGQMETVLISARGLKTLVKWTREGKPFDLQAMTLA